MFRREHRITLIARKAMKPDVDWNYSRCRGENVMFLDSVGALKFALRSAEHDGLDIERMIIDRAATAEDFLDLLVAVPAGLAGDILMIHDDGAGFMSATGRGGDRLLYALTRNDVRFYLETLDLVTGRIALPKSA